MCFVQTFCNWKRCKFLLFTHQEVTTVLHVAEQTPDFRRQVDDVRGAVFLEDCPRLLNVPVGRGMLVSTSYW